MDYRQAYRFWTHDGYFDEDTRRELLSIAGDEKEIEDRFYRHLEFGTAGLRGVIGAGTNRMNAYTVRRATQGLADAVNAAASPGRPPAVAVAFDTRRMSAEFAMETAGSSPPTDHGPSFSGGYAHPRSVLRRGVWDATPAS